MRLGHESLPKLVPLKYRAFARTEGEGRRIDRKRCHQSSASRIVRLTAKADAPGVRLSPIRTCYPGKPYYQSLGSATGQDSTPSRLKLQTRGARQTLTGGGAVIGSTGHPPILVQMSTPGPAGSDRANF